MTACRYKVIVAASLHNVSDRSAIDLQIENYIPAKARTPQNNQAPTGLGGGSPRNVPAAIAPDIKIPQTGQALYVFALP